MPNRSKSVEVKRFIAGLNTAREAMVWEPVKSAILGGLLFAIFMASAVALLTYLTDKPEIIISGTIAAGSVLIAGVVLYCFSDLLQFAIFFWIRYVDDSQEGADSSAEDHGRD